APRYHPAMRFAGPARRDLGVRTTFNFLGPLANPTKPQAQAIGCADPRVAPVMASVFAARGVDAWVFRGDDGLDELTITTTSTVWRVHDGEVETGTVDPTAYGLEPAPLDALRGGDVQQNADVVRRLLDGERGAVREAVLLNAGAALEVAGAATDLDEGIALATGSIDEGQAAATLDRWIAVSREAGGEA
ncbi:MAG TPA: anthranilate phosphoribosyltransferase, partial [Actinomycetota bacterium]|nr:anthranilate phosphoribosyltransferase [Actinomycetota bacterium]